MNSREGTTDEYPSMTDSPNDFRETSRDTHLGGIESTVDHATRAGRRK